ncbi:MAG: putative rane protein putative virulence factor [Rickettsiaceae bacterium]|jgi:putative peptidoglycan lipid II flippase|nr:putative rane protein putative virulence factor [Rickettsiaceae bacterium]
MSLFKSAATVGGYTFLSRILGYIRDMFIASALGVGALSDAFIIAFRLPNIFRALSAEGAFNSAFVPLFAGKLTTDGKEQATSFAGHVMSFMFIVLVAFSIIMELCMPFVMHIIAPGFKGNAEQFGLSVELSRIMFPYLVFISLVALYSGILNSMGKFAVASAAPIWLNITMILAIVCFDKYTKTPAHALAWGVFAAGVIQLVWLLQAAYKAGVVLKPCVPKLDSQLKTLLKRMVPGIIGSGITQINILVSAMIATSISGAITYLYYADRVVQFPMAIIGTAMGTALLPTLSKQLKQHQTEESIKTQNKALEIGLLLTIPAAAALMVMAEPLITMMFERGKFSEADTLATKSALIAYAIGLPAFVLLKIFTPVYFANGDTRTPVKIAAICFFANIALSIGSVQYIGHVGVAFATTVSSWLNIIMLCGILMKRNLYRMDKTVNINLVKIAFSAAVMAAVLWYLQIVLKSYLESSLLIETVTVLILIVIGMVSFFAVVHLVGGHNVNYLKYLKRKQ